MIPTHELVQLEDIVPDDVPSFSPALAPMLEVLRAGGDFAARASSMFDPGGGAHAAPFAYD